MTEELSRKYPDWDAPDLYKYKYIKAVKSMVSNNDLDSIDLMLKLSDASRARSILHHLPMYAAEADKVDILHYAINKRGIRNMDDLDYRDYMSAAIKYRNPAVFKYLLNFEARYSRKEQNLLIQALLAKILQFPTSQDLYDDLKFAVDNGISYDERDVYPYVKKMPTKQLIEILDMQQYFL